MASASKVSIGLVIAVGNAKVLLAYVVDVQCQLVAVLFVVICGPYESTYYFATHSIYNLSQLNWLSFQNLQRTVGTICKSDLRAISFLLHVARDV